MEESHTSMVMITDMTTGSMDTIIREKSIHMMANLRRTIA